MVEKQSEFRFDEERNLGVYTCSRVWDDQHPILMVSHEEDGDWQFLCGGVHEEGSGDEIRLVCLEHLVDRDPTLNDVADLCPLWWAERSIGMWKSWGAPEILCMGLPAESAQGIINHVADLVRGGAPLVDGVEREDVLNGYRCKFRAVAKRHVREYLGYASWFYEGQVYPVLQLVYPDREGRFPEEEGVTVSFARGQPRLWE